MTSPAGTIAELELPGVPGFDGGPATSRAAVVRVVAFAEAQASALQAAGLIQAQAADDLRLVLEELLTNVIRHGFANLPTAAGACVLTVDLTAGAAGIEITDNGSPFDPFDPANEPGYGLRLVRALARSYSWSLHEGAGNRLRVQLPLA